MCLVTIFTCGGELADPRPDSSAAVRMAVEYYLKEDEEQKEVLEAEDDEEKESEVDGEVEGRESLNVRMKHGDDNETNKAQT